jgi:hypothetical protein
MRTLNRILEIAAESLPAAGVDCLLIGGFAVNHYGYSRNTLDVDFMPDIAYLSVLNDLDLEADIRPLCDRFGTHDAYQAIRNQVRGLTTP